MVWLQKELMDATNATAVTKIAKTMDTVKELAKTGGTEPANGSDGVLLYIWAITDRCARETDV